MRAYLVGVVAALGMGTLGGCGLTLDLEPDPDGGTESDLGVLPREDMGVDPPMDGGPLRDCEGAEDGAPCGGTTAAPYICVDERCIPAECGDGFVTGAEVCDDGNLEDGDGCQASCFPGCIAGEADDCPSTECSVGICDLGRCVGEPVTDGTVCTGGVCMSGVCADPLCGNGSVDGEEACDDGNRIDGDGCDNDCTPSCADNDDCQDGILCNGVERCVELAGGGQVCMSADVIPTAPRVCDYCDERTGDWELDDEDGDGFSALGDGEGCGPADCDDTDPTIYPGAPEITSGVDSDCDGAVATEVSDLCYGDADSDGFGDPDETMTAGSDGTCPPGFVPAGPVDCDDENADVNPGQLMYFQNESCDLSGGDCSWDYNCDGREERRFTEPSRCVGLSEAECEAAFAGWAERTIPECGESARWATCNWSPLLRTCSRSLLPSPVVQSCR